MRFGGTETESCFAVPISDIKQVYLNGDIHAVPVKLCSLSVIHDNPILAYSCCIQHVKVASQCIQGNVLNPVTDRDMVPIDYIFQYLVEGMS